MFCQCADRFAEARDAQGTTDEAVEFKAVGGALGEGQIEAEKASDRTIATIGSKCEIATQQNLSGGGSRERARLAHSVAPLMRDSIPNVGEWVVALLDFQGEESFLQLLHCAIEFGAAFRL